MTLQRLKKLILMALLLMLVANNQSSATEDSKYLFGVKSGLATLTGGETGKFPLQLSYGLYVGYRPSPQWVISVELNKFRMNNDTTTLSSFSFVGSSDDADRKWQAKRFGIMFHKSIFDIKDHIYFSLGFGGGMMNWSMVDPKEDTLLKVIGPRNQRVDFDASELFLGVAGDMRIKLSRVVSFHPLLNIDYLTGGGAEFAQSVIDTRDKWLYNFSASFSFSLGRTKKDRFQTWVPERSLPAEKPSDLDSDGDGIPDKNDRCGNTPLGAVVDRFGCPTDSDGDGVVDGFDDCPNTSRDASGKVDIYGCPVDRDFDGIPDYKDNCPDNQPGALVDETGCPIDTDNDGVPDGLDDCPGTLVGVDVDRNGCIDLSMFSKPMVLNIDYSSGSFEVDYKTKERLQRLARLLGFVNDVKLEINGYTDNIGTTKANQDVSQKRANRIKDYLVMYGISEDRIKAFGKGESNFVASNDTAPGRAKNRRIEIIFYK